MTVSRLELDGMLRVLGVQLPFSPASFAVSPHFGEFVAHERLVDRESDAAPADVFNLKVTASADVVVLLDQRE